MTEIVSQSRRSPLTAQGIDLGHTSESRGSSPPVVPMTQGDTRDDHGDRAPFMLQDLADGTLVHAAEYVALAIQGP